MAYVREREKSASGRGVVCLQLAPPRPPGTDLEVGTESRRHEEVFTGRGSHELRVIHTNAWSRHP